MILNYNLELEQHQIRSVRSRMPVYSHPTEFKIVSYSFSYPTNHYDYKKLSTIVLKDILTNEMVVIENDTVLFKRILRVLDTDKELLEQEVSIFTIWQYLPWLFCLNNSIMLLS